MQYRYDRSQLRPEVVQGLPRDKDIPEFGLDLRTQEALSHNYRVDSLRHAGDETLICTAHDLRRDQPVALKILPKPPHPSATRIARFVEEVELATRVKHPNVVEMHELVATGSGALIASMELVNGEDLATTLVRRGRLRWTHARTIILELCAGLDAVHAAGLVHCALEPSNCMRGLGRDGAKIKLLDFGAARREGSSAKPGYCALEAARSGSKLDFGAAYAAPELVSAEPVDARCDVYALGALLCVLLTGRPPYAGATSHRQLLRSLYEPLPSLLCLGFGGTPFDEQLEDIHRRALAKHPEERFDSAKALASALAALPAS